MTDHKGLVAFITVCGVLVIGIFGYLLFNTVKKTPLSTYDFDSCMKAGYPIQESYPAVCTTPEGKTFTQEVSTPKDSSSEEEVPVSD